MFSRRHKQVLPDVLYKRLMVDCESFLQRVNSTRELPPFQEIFQQLVRLCGRNRFRILMHKSAAFSDQKVSICKQLV